MAKKKKHAEHVNLERWLISYADFITLLFAFFVVMFASAYDSDDSKAQHLAKMVNTAFTMNAFRFGGTQVHGKKMYAVNEGAVLNAKNRQALSTDAMRGKVEKPKDMSVSKQDKYEPVSLMRDQVTQEFFNELKKHNVDVTMESRGLVVNFNGVAFFEKGSVEVKPESEKLLQKVVKLIKDRKNFIQVEGHADGTNTDKAGYASQMDISMKRAAAVSRLLQKKYQIPEEYISTTGYGSFRPLGDTKSAKGQAENRRVDLVLLKTVPDERKLALPGTGPPQPQENESSPQETVAVDEVSNL